MNGVAAVLRRGATPRWLRWGAPWLMLAALTLGVAACGSLGQHRVQAGETLYSISFRYGQDYHEVARWNQLKPPYTIYEGQLLRVAPAVAQSAADDTDGGTRAPPPVLSGQSPPPRPSSAPPKTTPGASARNGAPVQWRWPAAGRLVQGFSGDAAGNKGVDIAGKAGQPVRAAAGGRVVYAGSGLLHYGNLIIIKHNDTFLSAYAHNRQLRVTEGAEVSAGQHIADMGTKTNGEALLHFQIRLDGKPVDPLRYLPALR